MVAHGGLAPPGVGRANRILRHAPPHRAGRPFRIGLPFQRDADGPADKYLMYWVGGRYRGDTREEFLHALGLDADATDVEVLNFFGTQHWEMCGRDTGIAFGPEIRSNPGLIPGVVKVDPPTPTGKRTIVLYLKRPIQ